MLANKVLIVDEGQSILVNLTAHLGSKVFAVGNLKEAQKALEYNDESVEDSMRPWRVIVVGREGGMEQSAKWTIEGIRAKFPPPHDIPILLVTQTSEANEKKIAKALGGKATVLRVEGDIDFDLGDTLIAQEDYPVLTKPTDIEPPLPKRTISSAEQKFDGLIEMLLAWANRAPGEGRYFETRL